MSGQLDLTDPLVWELLERNHRPEEQTIKRTDGKAGPSVIVCEQDGMAWPCPTRLAIEDSDQPSRLHFGRKRPPE